MLRGPLTICALPRAGKDAPPAPRLLARLAFTGIAAAAAVAFNSASAFAQTDAGIYRAASELNVRAAPGIEAALLGVIPPAGRVSVFGCDAFGWCEVRYQDLAGWAARQFLVRTGDLPTDAFALRFTPPPEAEEGVVEVAGRFTPGAPCPILLTADGTEYPLLGAIRFHPADAIVVLGEVIATGACGTTTALAIFSVRIDR